MMKKTIPAWDICPDLTIVPAVSGATAATEAATVIRPGGGGAPGCSTDRGKFTVLSCHLYLCISRVFPRVTIVSL
ncbi:hypothetical protein TNCT_570591 [Trichonephila clavata]|uniref:Uncharacterized protein n=1 Tax=Trichonephila clavata TaxID=2740835 RepID=A0A8X6GIC8_TRICU|nr:hypothetical protein TNCT_570591 [Trichonephila clavata]